MPLTSVAGRAPWPTAPTTESTAVLAKRVRTRGKCSPAAGAMVVAADGFKAGDADDPWYPDTDAQAELEVLARRACSGCQVIASCRELTLRVEAQHPADVHGIAGALAPHERRRLLRARLATGRAA